MYKWVSKAGAEVVLLILIIGLFGWQLGQGSVTGDEAIYASVSHGILQTGDWLTLHLNGAPWYEKPPLAIWITAGFFKLFGVTALAARMEALIGAVGCIVTLYFIGRELFDRQVGLLAAAIQATTAPVLFTARFGNLDALLSFWIYLAIYAAIRARSGLRWWLVAGLACGGAIMTKGAAGLFAPLIIAGIYLVARVKVDRRAAWYIVGGSLVALVVVIPWHLAEIITHGRDFLSSYIGYHVLDRTTQPLNGHTGGLFFYLGVLLKTYEPWILAVIPALVYLFWTRGFTMLQRAVIMAPVGIVTLVTAIMETKQDWYFLPAYPALALLIAVFVTGIAKRYRWAAAAMVAAAALGIIGVTAIPSTRHVAATFLGHTYNRPTIDQENIGRSAAQDKVPADQPLYTTNAALDQDGNPSDLIFYSGRPVITTDKVPVASGHGDLIVTSNQAVGLKGLIISRAGNLALIKY